MTDPKNEVLFCEYCKTCKHKLCDCEDEPCCDCLAAPVNYYSHKPVLWEGVDTLFNKPVERRDHATERAVREAVYLNAKDTAEVVDKQGTLAGKVHMRDLISCAVNCINLSCTNRPAYTYGEMEDMVQNILVSRSLTSDATTINKNVTFGYTGWLNVRIPNARTIDNRTFRGCYGMNIGSYDDIKNVTNIGVEAFSNCYQFGDGWTSLNFDNVVDLGQSAFFNCHSIKKLSMLNVTNIPASAFLNCYSLEEVVLDGDKLLSIGEYAFQNCTSLNYLSSNHTSSFYSYKLQRIGAQAFANSAIKSISCGGLTSMGWGAFDNCTSLKNAYFTNREIVIPTSAFYGCTALEKVQCKATKIENLAFEDCRNLKQIEFDNTKSIPQLGDRSLPSPGILRSDFRIYVKDNLYRQWVNDARWAEYTNYIFPYTYNYSFGRGDYRTINVTHSTGGTLLSRKADVRIGDETIPFVVTMGLDDDMEVLSVFADRVDVTNSSSIELINNSVSVESVSGATYGFELNSDGYYVSQNKGVNNSAAVCRIKFVLTEAKTARIQIYNSGERGYDYGILGNVDQVLTTSNSADSNTRWDAKSASTGIANDVVIYTIPAGEHYVYIKYRKDGSTNSGDDCLKFKINNESSITSGNPAAKISYSVFDTISEDHDFYVQLSKKTT